MSKVKVNGDWHDKLDTPLDVEEGDTVQIKYAPPGADTILETTGTIDALENSTAAYVDVDAELGTQWLLQEGRIEIVNEGGLNHYNGALLDLNTS